MKMRKRGGRGLYMGLTALPDQEEALRRAADALAVVAAGILAASTLSEGEIRQLYLKMAQNDEFWSTMVQAVRVKSPTSTSLAPPRIKSRTRTKLRSK